MCGTIVLALRCVSMPRFHIRTINHEFDAVDEGYDYPDVAAARAEAVRAGAAISAGEIAEGKIGSIVEMRVEQSGKVVDRIAVASTMSPLRLAADGD